MQSSKLAIERLFDRVGCRGEGLIDRRTSFTRRHGFQASQMHFNEAALIVLRRSDATVLVGEKDFHSGNLVAKPCQRISYHSLRLSPRSSVPSI